MILIVDDHEDTRRILARLLRHSGYSVDTAADGVAALQRIEAARPEAVLLDYNMPEMNGLEVLETIRASAAHRDLPVIMFTAIDGDGVMNAAKALGVQGFVRKGVLDWGALLSSLQPFIEKAPTPRRNTCFNESAV